MKYIFTLLLISLVTFTSLAQNILSARSQDLGTIVTVSGIVTNGSEIGVIRYIQDESAGIGIYDATVMEDVSTGDSITVTGELDEYNGLLEIKFVSQLTVHGTGYLVSEQLITPSEIGEDTEGELVKINDVIFENGGSEFSVGVHNFSSNGESGVIYVKSGSELEGQFIPLSSVNMIAISSQFSLTGTDDGYQLLVRFFQDFEFNDGLAFTNIVSQSNTTNSGFDISWSTNMNSSSGVFYGLTEELELGNVYDPINNLNHVVSLANLEAGNIYYIQAYSIEGTDTLFSNIIPMATVSNSSGDIIVYFNKEVDNTVSSIEDAQNIGVYINDTIKAYIDKAMSTLDVAVYNHSDQTITNAINDAYERGVRVRYITCESTATTALLSLNDNIPVLERPDGTGIMHNKFIVIDAENTDSSWVMTGSTNWTSNQLFNDFNHLIFIQDETIAKTFELEFNEMWGSNNETASESNAKFGNDKANNTPHHFTVGGKAMEVYFSPSDNTTSKIANEIEAADSELYFGLLVFTQNQLGTAVKERNDEGVNVKGIIEDINTQGSEYEFLVESDVDVRSHQGVSDQFHHKYCIIDQGSANLNPTLITGSHNWSAIAESSNDENTIIIHDENIANQFYQEFINEYNQLAQAPDESWNCINEACIDPEDGTGTYNTLTDCQEICDAVIAESWNCINEACIDPEDGTGSYNTLTDCQEICGLVSTTEHNLYRKINVFPNPNKGNFIIDIISNNSVSCELKIFNLGGQEIHSQKVHIQKGDNQLNLSTSMLKGCYILKIDGSYSKFMVH